MPRVCLLKVNSVTAQSITIIITIIIVIIITPTTMVKLIIRILLSIWSVASRLLSGLSLARVQHGHSWSLLIVGIVIIMIIGTLIIMIPHLSLLITMINLTFVIVITLIIMIPHQGPTRSRLVNIITIIMIIRIIIINWNLMKHHSNQDNHDHNDHKIRSHLQLRECFETGNPLNF